MSRRRGVSIITLALLAGLGAPGAGVARAADAPDARTSVTTVRIDDLSWLAGSWSGEVKGAGSTTRFETHYTTPQGGVILSSSKGFRAEGKLSWFEFERFESKDGKLTVTPYPGGQPSVPFTLVEYDPTARKAVFANPDHDYPNRITYQRVAEDRLRFIVEGNAKDAPFMEFSLSRQP